MKGFFGDKLLLNTPASERLYEAVKELPIIDYHCHLNAEKIAKNTGFSDIGELWLSGDHYKWRAMRLCGVEEKYITGDVDYKEICGNFTEFGGKSAVLLDAHGAETDIRYPRTTE